MWCIIQPVIWTSIVARWRLVSARTGRTLTGVQNVSPNGKMLASPPQTSLLNPAGNPHPYPHSHLHPNPNPNPNLNPNRTIGYTSATRRPISIQNKLPPPKRARGRPSVRTRRVLRDADPHVMCTKGEICTLSCILVSIDKREEHRDEFRRLREDLKSGARHRGMSFAFTFMQTELHFAQKVFVLLHFARKQTLASYIVLSAFNLPTRNGNIPATCRQDLH